MLNIIDLYANLTQSTVVEIKTKINLFSEQLVLICCQHWRKQSSFDQCCRLYWKIILLTNAIICIGKLFRTIELKSRSTTVNTKQKQPQEAALQLSYVNICQFVFISARGSVLNTQPNSSMLLKKMRFAYFLLFVAILDAAQSWPLPPPSSPQNIVRGSDNTLGGFGNYVRGAWNTGFGNWNAVNRGNGNRWFGNQNYFRNANGNQAQGSQNTFQNSDNNQAIGSQNEFYNSFNNRAYGAGNGFVDSSNSIAQGYNNGVLRSDRVNVAGVQNRVVNSRNTAVSGQANQANRAQNVSVTGVNNTVHNMGNFNFVGNNSHFSNVGNRYTIHIGAGGNLQMSNVTNY